MSTDEHDARIVEIVAALLLGAGVGIVLLATVWLFGWLAAPPRDLWDPVIAVARPLAVAAGVLAVLGSLLRPPGP